MSPDISDLWGKIDFTALAREGIKTLDELMQYIHPGNEPVKIELIRCITCADWFYLIDPEGKNKAALLWYSGLRVCPDCDNAPVSDDLEGGQNVTNG